MATFGVVLNCYSIRFTPHPVNCNDISGWSFEYLKKFEKYIVAREDKDKLGRSVPVHYHIYIETSYGEATLRQKTKESLRLPAGGRGKNNGYYSLIPDWKDPGYICKYNEVVDSKGFTETELMDFVKKGKNKYLDKVESTPAENSVTAGQNSTSAKSPRIPYQQQIIAIASAEWYKYKRDKKNDSEYFIPKDEVKSVITEMVCKAMRDVSRGINVYLLQDLVYAVLYDDLDYRDILLERLKSRIIL